MTLADGANIGLAAPKPADKEFETAKGLEAERAVPGNEASKAAAKAEW